MPHVSIEYSANIQDWTSIAGLCDRLRAEAIATGVFPTAGVRVRAFRCDFCSIADGGPEHAFVDIVVKLRGGRPLETRKIVATRLFEAAREFLSELFEQRSIALSLEVRELEPELSPKTGSIREHLGGN